MKSYLLDTHTLLWMQDDNLNLSKKVKNILSNSEIILFVSIVSFWEITIKESLRKLELDYSLEELFEACIKSNIEILSLDVKSLKTLKTLPFFHKDPFDRMIIATAKSNNLDIISRDSNFKKYEVGLIW